jgi:hypothetical protein
MNTGIKQQFPFFAAAGVGLGVSTGYPAGIAICAVMPLLCLMVDSRKAAFQNALVYYAAALWPMMSGLHRYLGPNFSPFVPVGIWVMTALLLSSPWSLAWTSRPGHLVWRAPLALAITVVPPLGIIGFVSPLNGAGFLFPGTGWIGLALTAILPGLILSRRHSVSLVVTAGLFSVSAHLSYPGDPVAPKGWEAINTHFGDVSKPLEEYRAAQLIQQRILRSSARVLIFPEYVVPRWSAASELFWKRTLVEARARGQVIVIGAGLALSNPYRRPGCGVPSHDFSTSITSLERIGQPITYSGPPEIAANSALLTDAFDNAVRIVGAETNVLFQRIPVPIGMWRPLSTRNVPLRFTAPAVVDLRGNRAAVVICYEQMITWPMLTSMLERPTVLIAISNLYWFKGTSIPRFQAEAARGLAKLFRVPLVSAVNC